MKETLSEKHIRFFKSKNPRTCLSRLAFLSFIIFFVFLQPPVFSEEIITPKDIPPDLIRKIEEEVKSFQKPLKREEYLGIVSKTDEEARKALSQGEKKDIQPCPRDDSAIYYFFSLSMPEEVILRAMRDANKTNRECGQRAVLVLRGFVGNDLKSTIKELSKYLRKIGNDIPVEIDPELFERFGIRAVPQIIKVRGEEVGSIKGDIVSLSYAISRLDEELKDYGLYGRLYPIREEDPLKVFASKQKEIEERLRERLSEIRKRMTVLNKYDGTFEHAKEDRTYYIDPSVTLTNDIYDHQGRIIIHKGTVFNPADYIRLGRYVVIDGNSPKQVEFAIGGDFRKIILISGDLKKLVKNYRKPFYFANDDLIERFGIKRVPVVIEGEGKHVRITEKAL